MRGFGIKALELDFQDEGSIDAAAGEFGVRPLDVLINCAGRFIVSNQE